MPMLTIGDKSVSVGDDFLKLSPEQQNATVEEISKSLGASVPAATPDIGENRASTLAGLRGIPIAGAYADKAAAALNAIAQPLTETGLSHAPTFSERMTENEQKLKTGTDAYEKGHPIGTTVGKTIIGGAALAPLGASALGAKALGLAGDAVLPMMARGAASGGTIGATDAVARGENPIRGAEFGAGGGALGPLVGRAVGAGAEALANRALPNAKNALAAAAARQGVDFPKVAASDNLSVQRAGAALKEIPVIGNPIVQASRTASEQMGTALKNVEQGYGSGSVLNAGDVAKTGLVDWITGKSADTMKRLYGGVDSLVNPAITNDLTNTRSMIGTIAAGRQQAGMSGGGKAIDTVLEAVQRPGGLNYEGIKTLRTSVGEMLDNGVLPADISKTELKRIYGSLTQDLKDTVTAAGGPDALKAFNRANNLNVLVSQKRQSLAKIVGSEGDAAPERVMDRLIGFASGNSRADFQKLQMARKAIGGGNWDEVASAAVSRLGRDAQGNFSPDRFLTGFGKLSPNGKQMLFGSTGKSGLLSALEDINALSAKAKELASYGNPSGTGRVLGGLSVGTAMLHSPHIAIPAALGSRIAASQLAMPIKVRPATLRTAAQNADLAALVQHVTGGGVTGGAVAHREAAPQLPSPALLPTIPEQMLGVGR